ncbi:hypothetical protein QVD17_17467 [Tagetes erecta]|uniref:Uncharacterized protein n=1 Tax=Tagetes erecta TaxID=13708 RepID=A0AAD8P0C1_TARER|nr:hypothetical protein QVD17_17467 [Tagetes erecta]
MKESVKLRRDNAHTVILPYVHLYWSGLCGAIYPEPHGFFLLHITFKIQTLSRSFNGEPEVAFSVDR